MKNTLFKLIRINKHYFPLYVFLCFLTALVSFYGVAWSEAFRKMVNGAVYSNKKLIVTGFIISISVFVLDSLTQFLNLYIGNFVDNKSTIKLQKRLIKKVYKCNIEETLKNNSSYYNNIINDFVPNIQKAVNKRTRDFIGAILSLFVTLSYLLNIDMKMMLGTLILSVVLPALSNILYVTTKKNNKLLKERHINRDSFLEDISQAIIEINQFNLISHFSKILKVKNREILELKHKVFSIEQIIESNNKLSNGLCVLFILGYGGMHCYKGTLEVGDIIAFLYSLLRIFNPLPALLSMFTSIQSILTKADDIFLLLDYKENKEKKPIEKNTNIVFKNVCFKYPNSDELVLNNISFKIKKEKTTAIVGTNGSGKSTIIKLILGIYKPNSGEIYFDEFPISKFDPNPIISYVSQRSFIIEGTLKENLLVGNPKANDANLLKAIEIAMLKDFVKKHDDGLDYRIEESGKNISSGEIQRVCFARALLKETPIMILDEHTSNVDDHTQTKIMNNLLSMKNKTIILITHKYNVLKTVDNILYIEKGEIKETGNFDELMRKKKEFYNYMRTLYGSKNKINNEL